MLYCLSVIETFKCLGINTLYYWISFYLTRCYRSQILGNVDNNDLSTNSVQTPAHICTVLKPFNLKLTLKLKLQYVGHMMWRADSLEKPLMPGKIESRRRRGQQRMRWLDGITNSLDMSLSKLQGKQWRTGKPGVLQSMGSQRVGHDLATEQQLHKTYFSSFVHWPCTWFWRAVPSLPVVDTR